MNVYQVHLITFSPDDMYQRRNPISRPHFTTWKTEAPQIQVTYRSLYSELVAESVLKYCSPDGYPRLFLYFIVILY